MKRVPQGVFVLEKAPHSKANETDHIFKVLNSFSILVLLCYYRYKHYWPPIAVLKGGETSVSRYQDAALKVLVRIASIESLGGKQV
jgi:hypothetical protein